MHYVYRLRAFLIKLVRRAYSACGDVAGVLLKFDLNLGTFGSVFFTSAFKAVGHDHEELPGLLAAVTLDAVELRRSFGTYYANLACAAL